MSNSPGIIPIISRSVRKCPPRVRLAIIILFAAFTIPRVTGRFFGNAIPSSQAVYDCNGQLLRLSISDDEKYRLWVPISKMPSELIEATLLKEDRYFWFHPGVNPLSTARAFWGTFIGGGRKTGGSTITMQLVRIRYRLKTRSVTGKLYQMFLAFKFELFHTKKQILEAYLNLAPYGGNIEGAGAASLIYFSKDVSRLLLPEILALVVIPQNPSKAVTDSVEKERIKLLQKWVGEHPRDAVKTAQYSAPPVFHKTNEMPFLAPHFVDDIIAENPKKTVIRTTINLKLQRLLEEQIQNYVERKSEMGIHNASAMLVDMRDMSVVASVGSANYFDNAIEGQVNGTAARRSPGSSIKPIMYALAADQGIIHPMTILKDSPFGVGGFNPENFDGEFHGPLTVHEALIQSRNVPAVQVAAQLKDPDLYDFLKSGGVYLPEKRDFYGMSIVLGGAETTMQDMVKLYCMLAGGGKIRPLRFMANAKNDEGTRLLSPEACFLIMSILKDNPRPEQHYRSDWVKNSLPVYWKTGTSYSFRDAWSVGVFGHYALAVWIGNFNGVGNQSFVGIKASGPLFFQVVDAVRSLEPGLEPLEFDENINVDKVDVCSVSGMIPNLNCQKKTKTWFIPGCSPIAKCDIHRSIPIDIASGLSVNDEGRPGTRMEVFEFWPSDILKIFRMAGIPRKIPPPLNPSCSNSDVSFNGYPPRITSPQKGLLYHYKIKNNQENSIYLTAVSDADVRKLCWFVNKQYLGKVTRDKMLPWRPQPGRYIVRVVDDHGRSDSVDLAVRAVN